MSNVRPELNQLTADPDLKKLTWDEVESLVVDLGVNFSTVQTIKQGGGGLRNHIMQAYQSWLDGDLEASWSKVINSLKKIGKPVLAYNLEKKYPPGELIQVVIC